MKKDHQITIEAILFDLDGTLVHTEPTAAKVVTNCFREWKIDLNLSDASYVTGKTWDSALDFLLSKYSVPVPRAEVLRVILDRYRHELTHELILVPGGAAAVRALSQDYPLGLVSGSYREEILRILECLKIRDCFQIILGAEDYPRSKPHPDGYLKAIQFLNKTPQNCLVFEDSTAGISSARTAGCWVAAVTSTNQFEQDLSLSHFQIHDLTSVNPQWVRHLKVKSSKKSSTEI